MPSSKAALAASALAARIPGLPGRSSRAFTLLSERPELLSCADSCHARTRACGSFASWNLRGKQQVHSSCPEASSAFAANFLTVSPRAGYVIPCSEIERIHPIQTRRGNLVGKGESKVRLIKMFGLTALAAVAAMAFVGASSALATTSTSMCKVHQEPCAE